MSDEAQEKSRPRQATIRALFAASRNRCAFPKCAVPAYDAKAKSVLVEICHIEGLREGAARYRADQTDEERNGLENLILLCGVHHKVIDDDEVSYTVARLKEIKATHEVVGDETGVSADVVTTLLANFSAGKIYADTIVFSQNQMGGQIAKTIVNNAPPPRLLDPSLAKELTAVLRQFPPRKCEIVRIQGDPEVSGLTDQLRTVLTDGGWTVGETVNLAGKGRGVQMGLRKSGSDRAPLDVSAVAQALISSNIMTANDLIGDESCEFLKIVIGHRR